MPAARGTYNPRPAEFLPRRPIDARPIQSLRRPATPLGKRLIFAALLLISTVAGAAITLVLWSADDPSSRYADDEVASQDRFAPSRQERARGWDAEVVNADRTIPLNFPRAVKTVRFTPPSPQAQSAEALARTKVAAAVPGIEHRLPSVAPMGRATEVRTWRYQLQGVSPASIAKSSSDLVVIDYADGATPFTRAQVEQMQRKPDGSRRIVLSYMSIGEAEDYRWYWPQRNAAWLGPENPKWKGNYGVRFWHDDWQKIIFEYTDRILAAGFDGVYLDKVDEYEEMGRKDDMVEFVARIAARAKAQRPDFLIVSQNGDQLIPDPKFRKAIDAFAREDLLYGETNDGVRNTPASIRESVARLKLLAADGKPVFVVEYPRNEEQARTATREISEHGFVGLMARRALDALER
jgi:cysteinyl-tRNA synthetase